MNTSKKMTGRELIQFVVDNNALDCELVLAPNGDLDNAIDIGELQFSDLEGLMFVNLSEEMMVDMGIDTEGGESDTAN